MLLKKKDIKRSKVMKENKEYQSMTREDAITVSKSRRKKSKFWYILGVITAGLIFFCLFFRVVTFNNDFRVITKKHPTFSNTFVDLDDFVKRYNAAKKEYIIGMIDIDSVPNSWRIFISFETYLRNHAIDPALNEELCEKGLIEPESFEKWQREDTKSFEERENQFRQAYKDKGLIGPKEDDEK